MKQKLQFFLLILYLIIFSRLSAAPLDGYLNLYQANDFNYGRISLTADQVNESLDIFGIREQDAEFSGTTVGDYQGYSGHLDFRFTRNLSVTGGAWQRELDLGNEKLQINTWKVAGQWQMLSQKKSRPALAMGYSYWWNNAATIQRTSMTSLLNVDVDNIKITNVKDKQQQLDFIATWMMPTNWALSLYVGVGRSDVSFDKFFVNYDGCPYLFTSPSRQAVTLQLAQSATSECQVLTVKRTDTRSPFPGPGLGIQYHSFYQQLGSSMRWKNNNWALHAGLRAVFIDSEVDSLIASSGKKSYTTNVIGLVQVTRKLYKTMALFVRGQYYHRRWLGEIPLTYNVLTAHRFNNAYGLMSLGIEISI